MMEKPYKIPKVLEKYTGNLPKQALRSVIDSQEEMIPELLKVLEYTIENFDQLAHNADYMAHLYAMYLLAQFREKRSYPLIAELVSNRDENDLDFFFGDTITEDLNRILASVCHNDLDLIKAIIEDEEENEFVRSAALDSLTVLYVHGQITREEIFDYFKTLFKTLPREENYIWATLVTSCEDLYPDVLYDDIKQAFNDNLVDKFVTRLSNIDKTLKQDKEAVLEKTRQNRHNTYIDDTIAEFEKWSSFRRRMPEVITTEQGQVVREGRKIGRNEPCPCGSGLKYKKCCGKGK